MNSSINGVLGKMTGQKIERLSDETRERLTRILLHQALNPYPGSRSAGVDTTGIDDYMEMWAEARPRDVDAFVASGGDSHIADRWKSIPPLDEELTAFGEDHFHEISPDFGEQCSPAGCRSQQAPNTHVTLRAVENGELVEDETFYRDILKALTDR